MAATSGLSAIIDEHGKARWQTTEFTQDTTVQAVSMRTGLTPAMRLGATPDLLAAILLLTALCARRPPHSDD